MASASVALRPKAISPNLISDFQTNSVRVRWTSPSLFSIQAIGSPGTASRRFFYGPEMDNFDIALLKETHVSESKVLEFRMETFNTFNHAQFFGASSVDGNFNSQTFGQVVSATSPRLMQAALKLRF